MRKPCAWSTLAAMAERPPDAAERRLRCCKGVVQVGRGVRGGEKPRLVRRRRQVDAGVEHGAEEPGEVRGITAVGRLQPLVPGLAVVHGEDRIAHAVVDEDLAAAVRAIVR